MGRRRIGRRLRATLFVVGYLLVAGLVSAVTFHNVCKGDAAPDTPYDRPEHAELEASIPNYRRTEESTYLTLLEWYQVFSYQEYAEWVDDEKPSAFPYFAAIGQSWSMYCHAYGETYGTYPFNGGNHLMLGVIGTSFSLEYGVKGVYEHTLGWLTQLDGYDTSEDRYAAAVAADYGEFIETDPWYAYPFGSKMVGVWTENPLVGEDVVRKLERKVFLTTEYGVKAGYAWIIKIATGAIYGPPPALDYVWAENVSVELLGTPGVRVVQEMPPTNGSYILEIPHYQGFTDAVPVLVRGGARFVELSANDEIVLTAIAPRDWTYDLDDGEELLALDVPTDPEAKRLVIVAPAAQLHAVITGLDARGVRTEHLFDY